LRAAAGAARGFPGQITTGHGMPSHTSQPSPHAQSLAGVYEAGNASQSLRFPHAREETNCCGDPDWSTGGLSDSTFAIVITLLVLEIHRPSAALGHSPRT
jgi:hypothetical protein